MSLKDHLLNSTNRALVTADCVQMIRGEVANKSGVSGLAIRGVLKVVNRLDPDFMTKAVEFLLEDFVTELDPFYFSFIETEHAQLVEHLATQKAAVTEALLRVTDQRLASVKQRSIKTAYNKLRPGAARHVEAAVPAIATLIQPYIS